MLDKKLDEIKTVLDGLCIENNIKIDRILNDREVIEMINSQVSEIILEMQNAVKKDHTIMNNVEKMFILD